MARLPGEAWLIQQIDGDVILFNEYTEEEIVRFDPKDKNESAVAQYTIHLSKLTDEQKSFAHFWCGYFYAHATGLSYDR